MSQIKVAFWNVENLFDATTDPSDIALDFEFTPAHGWTEEMYQKKLINLAQVVAQMHNGLMPDLLGVCEVENKKVLEDLTANLPGNDYAIAHHESSDKRGIDTSLLFRTSVFDLTAEPIPHVIHLRYPTRDIYEVHLKVKSNNAELVVFVNHWPSRMNGTYETEPFRITVAEHAGRLVDNILKLPRSGWTDPVKPTLAEINAQWNRNVLLMGDFNDEPYCRSIVDYLQASTGIDRLEEDIKTSSGTAIPALSDYLKKEAYLFNGMGTFLGRPDEGTHYYSDATNTMNVLDQFIVSKGLYFGKQQLKWKADAVQIFKPAVMAPGDKKRPKGLVRKNGMITDPGFSDHFPITGVLDMV